MRQRTNLFIWQSSRASFDSDYTIVPSSCSTFWKRRRDFLMKKSKSIILLIGKIRSTTLHIRIAAKRLFLTLSHAFPILFLFFHFVSICAKQIRRFSVLTRIRFFLSFSLFSFTLSLLVLLLTSVWPFDVWKRAELLKSFQLNVG